MNQTYYKNLNKKKLLHYGIVCNDAGGANIIFNTLKNIKYKKISILTTGPAIKISKQFFPNIKNFNNLNKFFDNIEILITGTSSKNNSEHNARKIANKKKIKSITCLDHWINYKSRFIRNKKIVLPDEIWVTDYRSYKIASKKFPKIYVKRIKNYYLLNELKKTIPANKIKNNKLLYISEPINDSKKTEFAALNLFFKKINLLKLPSSTKIIFRLHPSEKKSKYSSFLKKKFKYKISFDDNIKISSSLNKCKWAVGCRSYAMYIALKMGRKVYSSMPNLKGTKLLPFKKIIYIKSLN
jgi:hypothetical protein